MRFEVHCPRIGELRAKDVRTMLGPSLATTQHVDVLVLGPPGEAAWTGRVFVVDKRSGPGQHRLLACPVCTEPRDILFVERGRLACRSCLRRRTRRQRERSTTAWCRLGGLHEDHLLRLLRAPVAVGPKLELARRLADELLRGDYDRIAALAPVIDAAIIATDTSTRSASGV